MVSKLQCRYCDYTVPAWRWSKTTSLPISGWNRLVSHIENRHPTQRRVALQCESRIDKYMDSLREGSR